MPNIPEAEYTAYFYCKEENMILPLSLNKESVDMILEVQGEEKNPRPQVHNTLKRVIKALGGKVISVLIDNYKDDLYYAYIRIKKDRLIYDIDSDLADALCVALINNVPMNVNKEILKDYGIKITKDLLIQALAM